MNVLYIGTKKKRKKQYIDDFKLANFDPKGEDYQSAFYDREG